MSAESPVWTPSLFRIADANLTRFMTFVGRRGPQVADYDALYRWSVERPGDFWEALWEFAGVAGERGEGPALEHGDRMPGARWFPGATLNFAENLLRGPDAEPAIVFRSERGDRRELSWQSLRAEVGRVAAGLARDGVGPGDVVAAFLPNLPETVIAMLAAASRGATFTSCSPDFGMQGVLDRFGQVKPKVLFTTDGYFYAGKTIDSIAPIAGVLRELPSVQRVILVSYAEAPGSGEALPGSVPFADYGERGAAATIRAPAIRPSALRALFERHDGRAEMHRARRRRHAVAASQGASAAHGREAGRSPLLLHDLRLDDVELARERARLRGDDRPLRRLAAPSGA